MHASPTELAEKIFNMGGKNAYVKALPETPGYSPDKSRRRRPVYDKDGIIYVLVNCVNLKIYVGQTQNVDAHFREHFTGKGSSKALQYAIVKHGPEHFVGVILLAGIQDQTELDSAEIAATPSSLMSRFPEKSSSSSAGKAPRRSGPAKARSPSALRLQFRKREDTSRFAQKEYSKASAKSAGKFVTSSSSSSGS